MREAKTFSYSEWHAHWPLVLAAMMGLSFASVAGYSLTVFIQPLADEFGWSRAQLSLGLTIFALFAVPLSPVVGAMIDRWGSRRMAVPGIILSACAFAAFGTANGSFGQWIGLWIAYSFFALAIKTTVWTAAVTSVFHNSRGLALAVTLCGTAVAQTFAPLVSQWLIDGYGWRQAFLWIGAGWGGISLILILLFFFDARDHERSRAKLGNLTQSASVLGGLTLGQAFRTPAILRIALAVFLTTLLGSAITVHKVPILTELGISRDDAVLIAASAGVAGIAGKLITGWLFDRWSSGWIGGLSTGLPAIAFALMVEPLRSPAAIVIGMVLLGYATGAILQVVTYLTGRYGGLRHFGKIFGVMASLLAVGTALGSVAAGLLYDIWGSYVPLLLLGIPVGLAAGLLVSGLGAYPRWNVDHG